MTSLMISTKTSKSRSDSVHEYNVLDYVVRVRYRSGQYSSIIRQIAFLSANNLNQWLPGFTEACKAYEELHYSVCVRATV